MDCVSCSLHCPWTSATHLIYGVLVSLKFRKQGDPWRAPCLRVWDRDEGVAWNNRTSHPPRGRQIKLLFSKSKLKRLSYWPHLDNSSGGDATSTAASKDSSSKAPSPKRARKEPTPDKGTPVEVSQSRLEDFMSELFAVFEKDRSQVNAIKLTTICLSFSEFVAISSAKNKHSAPFSSESLLMKVEV